MKKALFAIGFLLVFTIVWAQENIAIVTDCYGVAYVKHKNDSTEKVKKNETILKDGDKLIVNEGAFVVLDTDYGDRKIFGRKEIIVNRTNLLKLLGKNAKKSSWLGIALNTIDKSKEIENYYRPGSVRGMEEEESFDARSLYREPFKNLVRKFGVNIDHENFLLYPRNGNVLFKSMKLIWNKIPDAIRYDVFVMDMDDGVIQQYNLSDTTVLVKKGILEPDNFYKWIVIADLGKAGLVDSGKFDVLDSSRAAAIMGTLSRIQETYNKKDPILGHFIAASFLNAKGLYSDALKEINVCIKQYPNNVQYWRIRALIHHNMGLSSIAKRDVHKIYQMSTR